MKLNYPITRLLKASLNHTTDVFERSKVIILFNLLVAFTLLNLITLKAVIDLGTSIIEPIIIGAGLITYLFALSGLILGLNTSAQANIFLLYQTSQNILFTFIHTPNDGFDSNFVGFTLLALLCTLLLSSGKSRIPLIIMSLFPYIYGPLIVYIYNPFPMLAAPPREQITELFFVPVSLIIYVTWVFSKSEIKAKRNIISQKQQIEAQHYQLADQHNILMNEQAKKQNLLLKIQQLLGQQVSEEVANELLSKEDNLQGKLYNVTVMFLDIREFAKYADSTPPKEVARFQNHVFGEIMEIIQKHHGITNQILGDGVMAVFGAPVRSKDHERNAVFAGYAILGKIKELSEKKVIPHIKVGIGLNSGKVLAGNVGNNFRKQYSLTGSTVIIASRIEQLNKAFKSQFLISESVYRKIKHSGHPIKGLGKNVLKGIEEPIDIYQLS